MSAVAAEIVECCFELDGDCDSDGWPVSKGFRCDNVATHLLGFDEKTENDLPVCESCIPRAQEYAAECWDRALTVRPLDEASEAEALESL